MLRYIQAMHKIDKTRAEKVLKHIGNCDYRVTWRHYPISSKEFCQNLIAHKLFIKSLTEKLYFLKRLVIHRKNIHRVNVWVDCFLAFQSKRISLVCIESTKKNAFLHPIQPFIKANAGNILPCGIVCNIGSVLIYTA